MQNTSYSYTGKKTLEVLEGAENYNKWIAEALLPFLNPPILEIGSGIGNITAYIIQKKPLFISDKDNEFVSILKKKFKNHPKSSVVKLDISMPPEKKFICKFNSIVAINVLEHIEKDLDALKNSRKMLKNKGNLVLLVPAKKAAFTRLDSKLGHYRRYEKEELKKKLIDSGFKVKNIFFFNFLGLLSWVIRDKVSKTNIHLDPNQVSLFDKVVLIAKQVEKRISIPVGISIIAVGEKV